MNGDLVILLITEVTVTLTHNLAIDEPWKANSSTLVRSLLANILQRTNRQ